MTAILTIPAPSHGPGIGALLRSEVLRARSRRSLRWLTLLALLGVVGIAAIMWFTSARVTSEDLAIAAEQFRAEQQQAYEMCLADPNIPEAERPNLCWKPTEQDALANAIWTLPKRPFDRTGLEGLVSFAGGIGLLVAVMLAATSGGADWGARTMGLLLSWEPRRTRVFLVRLARGSRRGTGGGGGDRPHRRGARVRDRRRPRPRAARWDHRPRVRAQPTSATRQSWRYVGSPWPPLALPVPSPSPCSRAVPAGLSAP